MKLMTKTLFSVSLTVLALLISGCGEDSSAVNSATTTTIPTVQAPKQAGWYAATEVRATANDGEVFEHKTAGVFGELAESSDAQDTHDIAAYGPAILQVVFVQDGLADGNYFSNYQHFDENSSSKKVWTFQVRNDVAVDLSTAPITLSLKGVYDLFYKNGSERISYEASSTADTDKVKELNLVDVDNQTSYTVEALSTANLTMENLHVRTFRWVLGSPDASDFVPLAAAARVSAFSKATVTTFTETVRATGNFGLPPQ